MMCTGELHLGLQTWESDSYRKFHTIVYFQLQAESYVYWMPYSGKYLFCFCYLYYKLRHTGSLVEKEKSASKHGVLTEEKLNDNSGLEQYT